MATSRCREGLDAPRRHVQGAWHAKPSWYLHVTEGQDDPPAAKAHGAAPRGHRAETHGKPRAYVSQTGVRRRV